MNKITKAEISFLKKRQKALEKKLGCMFIRINTSDSVNLKTKKILKEGQKNKRTRRQNKRKWKNNKRKRKHNKRKRKHDKRKRKHNKRKRKHIKIKWKHNKENENTIKKKKMKKQ